MKVIAKKNRELALINAQNTQNENRAEIITLVVPEEYEDYNKKIVFVTDDGTVWDVITNNEYKITNAITKYKQVDFYIWLTKEVDGESIDFRTKTKTLNFYHNEDASDEITDEEIHGVNTVVNLLEEEIEKVENLNIEATKIGSTTTVTITKKDGTNKSVEILDGLKGADAKINGVNTLTIEAGDNITLDQEGSTLTINSTGGGSGGTSNYNVLTNKPKINNVELNGNKSLNDLGIQPKGNYLISETDPTVPSYVKNITQTNITNWNNKSDFSGSYNDLSNKPTIPEELKDLSDDSTHRLVTDTEKSTWNNKSDFSGNYNDLTNKPTIPSEVTETTVSNWGFTKNTGTITGITMNGASKGTSGVVNLGTVITQHQDISGKEDKTNKVTSISSNSTDTQYPSAKAVYKEINPYEIPNYWKNAVETCIETVKTNQQRSGKDCVSFAWFSDIHFNADSVKVNSFNVGKLCKKVMDSCNIPFALFTGDYPRRGNNVGPSQSEMLLDYDKYMSDVANVIGKNKMIAVPGNHDTYFGTGMQYRWAEGKRWDYIYRFQNDNNKVFSKNGSYFYVDYPNQKFRVIGLNCLYTSYPNTEEENISNITNYMKFVVGKEQLEWLANEALVFEETGWAVMVTMHVRSTYTPVFRDGDLISGVLTAYQNGSTYSGTNTGTDVEDANYSISVDFTNKICGDFVGMFAGHEHIDQLLTHSGGWHITTIDADFIQDEQDVLGTTTEDAIDFVTIDKKNRTVYLTRLGDGQNRSYTYTSINNLTITNLLTNVETNNSDTEIFRGASYSATLTPTIGDIDSVSVTMSNIDITATAYNSDTQTIFISNVTGSLVISATAGGGTYTNQIPISTDVDGSIYNTTGYKTASRIKSNGTVVDNTGGTLGTFVTGFIPIQQGDIVRLYNCWQDPNGTPAEYGMDYGGLNNGFFANDKTTLGSINFWGYNQSFGDFIYDSNGNIIQMTVKVSSPYVRLTLSGTASEAIVTINEVVS